MSNPPPAPHHSLPNPLVTPAASTDHDCPKDHSQSPHHWAQDRQLPQGVQEAPSPSRAESPTVHQWSEPAKFHLQRTATAPLERLSRPESFHSPQLSERDSIFATHYLPSESGANTPQLPPATASENERQVNLIPGLDDAPEPSSPLSKVSPPRPHGDSSPMEVDVRRHLPVRSASLFSSSEAPRISLLRSSLSPADQWPGPGSEKGIQLLRTGPSDGTGTHTGGVQDPPAERNLLPSVLENASHFPPPVTSLGRDGPNVNPDGASYTTPAESSRGIPLERSSSRGRRGRVDSSIEANLANAEPASNVRSRKSSHYLGLFKENTTSPERKRWEDRDRQHDEISESNDRVMDQRRLSVPAGEDGLLRKSISLPSLGEGPTLEPPSSTEPPREIEEDSFPRRPPVLPRRLLEEIRNFHLTPGGGRGSSFSQSIPTQYAERAHDYFQSEAHVDRFPDSLGSLEGDERRDSTQFEYEENEQISSAVYFPHERVAVPEGVDDQQPLVADSHSVQPVSLSTADQGHELMLIPQERRASPEQEVSHVDISFRSKNESKILHGDLPDLRSPTEGIPEKPLSTISEYSYDSGSELPSADESVRSVDDSSLTEEVTPTATPIQRSRALSRRKPPGPLGAVELKPYRHQVGGHTTVFRFSRRAVCKQLNNRENEFYERIERRHPDMLMFLPRYVRKKKVFYPGDDLSFYSVLAPP